MQFITQEELKNTKELEAYIEKNHLDLPHYQCAIIALITDKEGNILLQRRGPKSRDENFKLEDISGGVEKEDASFLQAVQREIREEVGDQAQFTTDRFLGCFLNAKYDKRVQETISWLFFVYKLTYEGGPLLINEPGKCLGYEFYSYVDLPKNEVTESSLFYWKYYYALTTCFSYVMGVGNSISSLRFLSSIQKEDDGYAVSFSSDFVSYWEEFIEKNLEKGYWNEYIVENKIVFLFKNTDSTFEKILLSQETNAMLLEKCSLFADTSFSSIRSMICENAFYKDKVEEVCFFD